MRAALAQQRFVPRNERTPSNLHHAPPSAHTSPRAVPSQAVLGHVIRILCSHACLTSKRPGVSPRSSMSSGAHSQRRTCYRPPIADPAPTPLTPRPTTIPTNGPTSAHNTELRPPIRGWCVHACNANMARAYMARAYMARHHSSLSHIHRALSSKRLRNTRTHEHQTHIGANRRTGGSAIGR